MPETNQTAREFLAQWCAEARKRCDAATPWPWEVARGLPTIVDVAGRDRDARPSIAFCGTSARPKGGKDAALIVIAANALHALIAFVDVSMEEKCHQPFHRLIPEAKQSCGKCASKNIRLHTLATALGWKEGE